MTDPHRVDLDELLQWIDDELKSSVVYAASTKERKYFEVAMRGGYIVRHGTEVVYHGTDGRKAVTTYNEISAPPTDGR